MKNTISIFFILLPLLVFIPQLYCNAATDTTQPSTAGFVDHDDGDQDCPSGQTCLDNPLGNIETTQDLIGQVINAILGVVGSLALLMFVYGGLTWMTAAGNEEKIKKGKGILMWATIGLVVIFTSYAVLKFIISVLQGS